MKPWHSLFRNRRGAVCAVCVALIFTLAMILGTWSARCFLDAKLYPLPDGTCTLAGLLLASGCFKYRDDRVGERDKPPAAP